MADEYTYTMKLRTYTDPGYYWKVINVMGIADVVGTTQDESDADWFVFDKRNLSLSLKDGRNLWLATIEYLGVKALVAGNNYPLFTFGFASSPRGLQFQTRMSEGTKAWYLTSGGAFGGTYIQEGEDDNDPGMDNPAFWFSYSGCDSLYP